MGRESWSDRKKRVFDAIELQRTPDRVPLFMKASYLPARIYGIAYEDAYYDQDKWLEANRRFIRAYRPDMFFQADSPVASPGPVHELLGNVQMKWPGHGIDKNAAHQFVDKEFMKRADYEAFIDDPSDFLIRRFVPELYENLAGLSKLPNLKTVVSGSYSLGFMVGMFADPDIQKAIQAIMEASKVGKEWGERFDAFHAQMEEEGYVASYTPPVVVLPFDAISSYLRGMRGALTDMLKVPEKLLCAQAKLLSLFENSALFAGRRALERRPEESPRIYIPLHRGGDGFMSAGQFETFYWPDLKHMLFTLIDAGITPMPFFEGCWDSRLEYLCELPKGKVLGVFDKTDLKLAKKIVGGNLCLCGGMPSSMLQIETPERIREFTKDLIVTVGRDGGFIMCTNTVLDEAKPELVKAWADATREFGAYA
ncbi:MAG: uroporphyrinogen decarboxylase family protein [Bacillota bacterium]